MKKIGAAVLGLAVLIGLMGKLCPHLFLSLPFPLSMILWGTTGNDFPPYFMQDAWKEDEIDTWTKDGDLIVATMAKAGTTFMLYCTHQIRTRGRDRNDTLFLDVGITTPWMDLRQSRAGHWAEQKDRYNTTILPDGRSMKELWDHESYPFRIFKSHYGPPILPVRRKDGGGKKRQKQLKYLAMVRNGIDVAASMTPFYTSHTEEFRKLWGGFPPAIAEESYNGDTPPAAVKDMLPGGPIKMNPFDYAMAWWPYRNDPNVLLLHYTNVRRDLKGHVIKIAKFLGVKLSKRELKVVTERCGLPHMKKKSDLFRVKMVLNQDEGWDNDKTFITTPGALTNKGGVGTGAAMFSDKVVAQWKKAEEDMLGHDPVLLKWTREGGELPPV